MVGRGALNTGLHVISEMIKAWIEDCVDNHPDCATAVQMTGRLPTRLLQIEKSGKSFKVKLCLSSALSPSTSYATLSHVWGSGSPMKLVNKNVLQCQQDIPIASLPQTFADAIQLTNALGLSYLWIDSLCIIQDSTLDWEVESTTMCDVYRGSTINIAASASVDCNGGLFRQRNPFLVTSCMMEVSHKQKEAGAREGEPYALLCEIACDGDLLVDEPLSRRAWAVQERILAPRTVYFTAQKIYFVCREKRLSDIDPCGFYEVSRLNHSLANTWDISRPALGTSASELYVCSKIWQRVVQQYTHGQLSYESDKLVAIAGLAEHMQGKWLGPTITYLGGLWSFDLIEGLTWRRNKTLTSLARPKAYRAPSWSWASVEGEVEWWPDLESWPDVAYRASIVEARTSPTSKPFGSVHGGYIQIRGHLCTMNDKVSQFYPVWDVVSVDGRDGREHIIAASNELMVFTLLIDRRTPRSHSSLTSGLLLEYIGDKKGQYKRIGSFRAFGSHLLHTSRSFRPAEHLFMEVNADNEYTIELI